MRNLRRTVAILLALALLAPGLVAKERRGANLVVTKKDGAVVRGELLAVKGTDLLIMDGSTAAGVTVSLADVRTVRVAKKTRILQGMGAGFLFGGLLGAGVGALTYTESSKGWDMYDTRGESVIAWGLFLGVIGVAVGAVAGGIAGIDRNIRVNENSTYGMVGAAEQLRPYARDRG